MASGAADYLESEWMKYAFTATAMGTRPTTWYVALHSADPTDVGNVGEISGSSYARTSTTWTQTAGQVVNAASITFPTVTSSGYTVAYFSVYDASTAGNCLFQGALAVAKSLAVGEAATFAAGELILAVD